MVFRPGGSSWQSTWGMLANQRNSSLEISPKFRAWTKRPPRRAGQKQQLCSSRHDQMRMSAEQVRKAGGGIGQGGREGYDSRTVRIEHGTDRKQRCIPPHAPFQCCYNNESIRRVTEGLPKGLGIARWLYDHHGDATVGHISWDTLCDAAFRTRSFGQMYTLRTLTFGGFLASAVAAGVADRVISRPCMRNT